MLPKLARHRYGLLLMLLSMLASISVYLADPVLLQILRNAAFDHYQRWLPRTYVPAPVHIIDIDEESLRRLGQWPWPRTRIAELVDRLHDAGASAIVFDVIFAEPDRTSPTAVIDMWQPSVEIASQVARLPDHDAVLAHSLAQGGVVLGYALDQTSSSTRPPQAKARYVVLGEAPQPYVHGFDRALSSLPALQQAASGNGAITFIPDADGIVRKVPLLLRQGEQLLPSLSSEALRVAGHADNYIIRSAPGKGTGLAEVRIGNLAIPTTAQGEVWVHYTRPQPSRYIPAWQVFAGVAPLASLKDNILLVGTSAHGIMDLRFSPSNGAIPGVEVHAQMLEQVLTGASLNRPSWARAAEVTVMVLGGVLVGVAALALGGILSLLVCVLVVAVVYAGAWFAFGEGGLLLDPVAPSLSLALTFVLAAISRHVVDERRQRWVRQAFSRYISPNLVNYLIDNPEALELSTRRTHCSFVFTDLAGFTTLMEGMDPAEATNLLNVYLDRMIEIAFQHQGTLDRIVGDSVAIMFSAPLPQPDHQCRALACALHMQRFAADYLAELQGRGIRFCATRIGIHSGEVMVGNFGGAAIFDYRALGDPVNTASRLENANRHLGTLTCVSEATLSGCGNAPARPIGRLVLKGKTQALMIYEPLDTELPDARTATLAAYTQAYALMRDGSAQALAAFEALQLQSPQDALVQLHIRRLQQGEVNDLVVMDEK